MPIFPLNNGLPARWKPVLNTITSTPGARSAASLLDVIRQFSVEHEPRYLRDALSTYCNIFAIDVISAGGIVAPRHWSDPATGTPTPIGTGTELSANKLFDWFKSFGGAFGWRNVDAQTARLYALAGKFAVAIWRNPNPQHSGHVAIVRPDTSPDIYVAQAGAVNSERMLLSRAFPGLTPLFWVHE